MNANTLKGREGVQTSTPNGWCTELHYTSIICSVTSVRSAATGNSARFHDHGRGSRHSRPRITPFTAADPGPGVTAPYRGAHLLPRAACMARASAACGPQGRWRQQGPAMMRQMPAAAAGRRPAGRSKIVFSCGWHQAQVPGMRKSPGDAPPLGIRPDPGR